MTFKDLLFRAGFMNFGKLNRKAATEFLHVTERTLDRWIKEDCPCQRAVDLLNVRINGTILIRSEWDGFYICREGRLVTPRGNKYHPDYINKLDFLQRTMRYQESQVASLEQQIEYLNDLVKASEQLKSIGNDLIQLSDKFRFKDAVLRYKKEKNKSA